MRKNDFLPFSFKTGKERKKEERKQRNTNLKEEKKEEGNKEKTKKRRRKYNFNSNLSIHNQGGSQGCYGRRNTKEATRSQSQQLPPRPFLTFKG